VIAIVWQFDVRPGSESEFEDFCGADGEWNAVNRHNRSYLGSSFLRDQNNAERYLLIEYWSEMLVYEQHRSYRSDEIARLDARRQALVSSVTPLGIFTALNVPERSGPAWSRRGQAPPADLT
jgi:quinol monooxygenase YgiN